MHIEVLDVQIIKIDDSLLKEIMSVVLTNITKVSHHVSVT